MDEDLHPYMDEATAYGDLKDLHYDPTHQHPSNLSKPTKQMQMLVFPFIPFSPSASWTSRNGAGPQIRMVPSSEALASSPGRAGFQLTQLTVRV